MNRDNIYKGLNDLKQKRKRTELKSNKVNLSKIEDIQEVISRGYLEEFVEEALDEAFSKFILAKDIVRFDMNDAYAEAEGMLGDFKSEIEDLGIDMPQDVLNLESELDALSDSITDLQRRIDEF